MRIAKKFNTRQGNKGASGEILAVFWDVDGVITDSEDLHKDTIGVVAKRYGVDVSDDEYEKHCKGQGYNWVWTWLKVEKDFSLSREKFWKESADYYVAHIDKIKVRPGFREVFNYFALLGVPQLSVSGSVRKQVKANLEAAGVEQRMTGYLSIEDYGEGKPSPKGYNAAYEIVKGKYASIQNKKNCLVIEDSFEGIKSGYNAGIPSVFWPEKQGVTSLYATYTVYMPEDFLKLVKKLTKTPEGAISARNKKQFLHNQSK